jgi:hypothetical protein
MAATLKLGDRKWATKEGSLLAYNDENNNFKPLPFDFTRASSATRVNKQGLIETVASGVPRIDFTDAKGALLLEPQRTNLITYSSDFSQWGVIGTPTLTSNYGISPDGTQNSTRIQFNNSDRIYEGVSVSGDITYSVYLKGVGQVRLRDNDSSNIKDITLTSEWVRYEFTFNDTITNVQIQQSVGTSDLEIWGAQVEVGSYATSYIPTQGSAVTVVKDVCTGAGNDQVINSTEGVLYAEIAALADDGTSRYLSISDGSFTNRVSMYYSSSANIIGARIVVGGSSIFLNAAGQTQYNNNKIAVKWKLNDYKLYINGVQVAANISGGTFTSSTLSEISFNDGGTGIAYMYGNVKDLQVFNTALTDAELIALTT